GLRNRDNESADNSPRWTHGSWLRGRGQPIGNGQARVGCSISHGKRSQTASLGGKAVTGLLLGFLKSPLCSCVSITLHAASRSVPSQILKTGERHARCYT